MSITEIRVAGFGGQGVILAGMIIGKAASIFEDGYATLTQSFGPEARGSACSAQVILSKQPILYPYLTRPHVLIAMSQDACAKFAPDLRDGGTLLLEQPSTPTVAMTAKSRSTVRGSSERRGRLHTEYSEEGMSGV